VNCKNKLKKLLHRGPRDDLTDAFRVVLKDCTRSKNQKRCIKFNEKLLSEEE
jgi:hypothetical protein